MEPTLRPLTLGEILDRTAQLYRTHFLLFAGIASVYAGILLVLSLLQIGAQEIFRILHMNQQLIWVTVIGILVLWLAIFTFGGIAVATNNRAVGWVYLGKARDHSSRILKHSFSCGSLLVADDHYLFHGLASMRDSLRRLCVRDLLLCSPERPAHAAFDDERSSCNADLRTGHHCVWITAPDPALAYAVFMGLRYSLAIPASVVENLPARAAIRRSIELSQRFTRPNPPSGNACLRDPNRPHDHHARIFYSLGIQASRRVACRCPGLAAGYRLLDEYFCCSDLRYWAHALLL